MTELRNIEAERVRHNLTQKQLATELGVTTKTLYSWIKRDTPIPSTKIIEMCRMWDVASDYLLSITDSTDPAA
ncbi:MAG: helix-turn-helix domain-containing protein [Clostridiales Family XIII bacterium]|jgi:transcriptional regulator with XRE-family HTH domain|nr:helix-turn-helix domain-containing protein [Clostridiales Family XIII bacterium]